MQVEPSTRASLFSELCVSPHLLNDEQRRALDEQGYLVLRGALDPGQVTELRATLDALAQDEGYSAGAPSPSPYQLAMNREQDGLVGRVGACAYRATFRLVRWVALHLLFPRRPNWKLALRARTGSPLFGTPQAAAIAETPSPDRRPSIRSELRHMLTTAAFTEVGVTRVCNLLNKSAQFDVCFTHATVLAGVSHLLGDDLKVSSVNYRAAHPGWGLQPLHTDWEDPPHGDKWMACNTLWVLDDYTESNGATRVVPGTHRSGTIPDRALGDPFAAHPEEHRISARAGDVILMNAHTWHSGTRNTQHAMRRIIQCYFVRRDSAQQLNQRQHLRPATRARLTPAQAWLLDVADADSRAHTSAAASPAATHSAHLQTTL